MSKRDLQRYDFLIWLVGVSIILTSIFIIANIKRIEFNLARIATTIENQQHLTMKPEV